MAKRFCKQATHELLTDRLKEKGLDINPLNEENFQKQLNQFLLKENWSPFDGRFFLQLATIMAYSLPDGFCQILSERLPKPLADESDLHTIRALSGDHDDLFSGFVAPLDRMGFEVECIRLVQTLLFWNKPTLPKQEWLFLLYNHLLKYRKQFCPYFSELLKKLQDLLCDDDTETETDE